MAAGKFLMPGLWDMHVHLGFARESAFPAFVANGVTAVRDLGGDLAELDRWRTEVAAGSRVGPLIVRVGPMLIGQDPLRFQFLIETPEQGRDMVRRLRAAGVEQIKVKSMSRDAYFAIIAEARALGLPVTGHIPTDGVAGRSVRRGTIGRTRQYTVRRHISDRPPWYKSSVPRDSPLARLRTRHARCSSGSCATGRTSIRRSFPTNASSNRVVDRPARSRLAVHGGLGTGRGGEDLPAFVTMRDRNHGSTVRTLREMQAVTRMMHDAGVKMLAGTDVSFINAPGFSLHDELELLVAAGLPPRGSAARRDVESCRGVPEARDGEHRCRQARRSRAARRESVDRHPQHTPHPRGRYSPASFSTDRRWIGC